MQIDRSLNSEPEASAPVRMEGRRDFLGQLASLAALGTATQVAEAAEKPAQSAQPQPLPTIQLGEHRISRLVAGSNPILGYSYAGQHADHHMKEYFTPERTVAFLQDCERAGITAHQFADPSKAMPYVTPLRESGSKLKFFCLHSEREKVRDAVALAKPIAMVHHGGATDRLFAEGKSGQVHDYVKAVRDQGVLAGVSAHNPDCIKRIADEGWEVDFFMTCFYFLTRPIVIKNADIPMLDFGLPFFKNDPVVMTEVVRQVKQPCFGFKILGSGRRCTNQNTVRAAFEFAFKNIKPTDGVIVGMFPWFFDEVSANAGFTRELGKVG